MSQFTLANKYSAISASTDGVKASAGTLRGMYVSSTTSGTIKILDGAAQSGAATMVDTITPAVGWHDFGNMAFNSGLSVTIANTLKVTLVYN